MNTTQPLITPLESQDLKGSEVFHIGRLISVLYRAGQSFFSTKASNFDIGGGHMGLIFHLYKHDGASQDELSKALEVDKATITRSVSKLEENGLVERQRDASDHRINRIVLTESGHAMQNDLKNIALEWQTTLLDGFTKEERDTLNNLFDKLMINARAYKHNNNK